MILKKLMLIFIAQKSSQIQEDLPQILLRGKSSWGFSWASLGLKSKYRVWREDRTRIRDGKGDKKRKRGEGDRL